MSEEIIDMIDKAFEELQWCLDKALDILESNYSEYSLDDNIAQILDIYKYYFD